MEMNTEIQKLACTEEQVRQSLYSKIAILTTIALHSSLYQMYQYVLNYTK